MQNDMKGVSAKHLLLFLLLTLVTHTHAQHFSNDLEANIYDFPWFNVHPTADTAFGTLNNVSRCDSLIEYGLGFEMPLPDSLHGKNLLLSYDADFRFPDTLGQGDIVLTIIRGGKTLYWQRYALTHYANDSAHWFHASFVAKLPADYLNGSVMKSFVWNPQKTRIFIDNLRISLQSFQTPRFVPEPEINLPWDAESMLFEYLKGQDTITEFIPFNEKGIAQATIGTTQRKLHNKGHEVKHELTTKFTQEAKLLRLAYVMPYEEEMTVYRRNHYLDTVWFQPEYYLDREGFTISKGNEAVSCYHPTNISSMQLSTQKKWVVFNIDYWRDHPLIHYPLSDAVEDVFEDCSYQEIKAGDRWKSSFILHQGNDIPMSLPRILPIPDGYESGIIFTEHADWTDIRTHRAVCFGNEHVTQAREATGGFVYYGIPVTKSVFYNNPDGITNKEASHGQFKGLHATIQNDPEFKELLDELDALGFEICLHTPEQYTSTPANLKEALSYMRKHYHSASWIDHGYNNGSLHNREDLVCDGLRRDTELYAGKLWKKNKIRYLWNAYYEENRLEEWCFDNNLMQPYLGFGDALPNRQITTIPSQLSTFFAWATPATLDANSDDEWDFYYHQNRLDRIVENHDVHITHVYPAWTNPARAFWTYNDEGDIVALPGMNRALERIATLRDERKMLPMTIKTYLDHYTALLQVEYHIIDNHTIQLVNKGQEIKGLTLLCTQPMYLVEHPFESKESGEEYMIWFDMSGKEKVTIIIE